MRKRGFIEQIRRRQYLIAGALVVIAAIGTTVLYSNGKEEERLQMEAELAEEMNENEPDVAAAVEETESAAEASALIQPKKSTETEETEKAETTEMLEMTETMEETEHPQETKKTDTAEVPEEPEQELAEETAAQPDVLHFSPEEGMLWPMEGNVILNYSMDSSIYFPTLDHYRTNPAVIIAGEVNSKVYSVAKGQVTRIEEKNAETGCTVTVDLGDGYQAVYGQLKELTFHEGDYVEAGHIIGYISEPTKYYSVEGSNLYFELLKDGVPINPVDFFQ